MSPLMTEDDARCRMPNIAPRHYLIILEPVDSCMGGDVHLKPLGLFARDTALEDEAVFVFLG